MRWNTPNPVQSTSSNHAWSVARSLSVTPVIPFGIDSRRCFVPLLPGPPSRASTGVALPPMGSCVRLKIESYPALLIAPATFQNTSSPRKRSSHCAASSSLQACSRGCSRFPPTLMIRAFNFRNDLVAVAQLNFLPPSSSSSKYHIGRTPTRLLAFSALAHLLCCTAFHCQSSISS